MIINKCHLRVTSKILKGCSNFSTLINCSLKKNPVNLKLVWRRTRSLINTRTEPVSETKAFKVHSNEPYCISEVEFNNKVSEGL